MNENLIEHADARPADHPPAAAGRIGVLLVNLGTPDATDYWSMRRYLKEFLSDRRVIEENRLEMVAGPQPDHPDGAAAPQGARLRQDLEPRARRIAAEDHHARAGREARRDARAGRMRGITVDWAMRYGNPSIASRLDALQRAGCERILIVPLYPQYCRRDHRDRRRQGVRRAEDDALAAGGAHRAAVA